MFTILIINQKGGVGKTTMADELAFALRRKELSASYISTDPQGGSIHVSNDEGNTDFQVVDTAGVLTENLNEWCRAADMVLIPMLPSTRDLEPTIRTYELAMASGTKAPIGFVINGYYARGVLERQLKEHLTDQGCLIWTEIPRTVALSRAASLGESIADYDPRNPAVAAFDKLAEIVVNEAEKTA